MIEKPVVHVLEDPWGEWLPELVAVYEAAHRLIYDAGTASALKQALDQIPLDDQ